MKLKQERNIDLNFGTKDRQIAVVEVGEPSLLNKNDT